MTPEAPRLGSRVSSRLLIAILLTSALGFSGVMATVEHPAQADSVAFGSGVNSPIDGHRSVAAGQPGGVAFLSTLATISAPQLETYLRENPSTLSRLLATPPHARAVVSWWGALPQSTRASFATAAPQLLGNLDGIPFDVRDAANRLQLSQSIARSTAPVSAGGGRAQGVYDRHRADVFHQIERTLVAPPGQPGRMLLTFDPSADVRAAVVVGDLATADYVSYLIPGMLFTVWGQMYDWTTIAADLQREQTQWIQTLSPSDRSLAYKTAATVSWIGYNTPGVLDITSLDRADVGAGYLKSAIHGLQASRAANPPFITLITHSYGSTAAMIDLDGGGLSVNALVIVGSPGGIASSARVLNVADAQVFVGEAAWDPVARSGFYGRDPGSPSFGAQVMDVSASTDGITGLPLAAAVGHLGYFDAGTTAMRNFALIALGRGALASRG